MNLFCNICVFFYSTPCLWIFLHFVTWKILHFVVLFKLPHTILFYFAFFLSSYPSHTQFFRPFSPSYDVNVVHVCAEFSTHIHRMCLLLLVLDVKEWARVSSFLYVITLLGITIKRGGVWHENSQASSTLIRDSFNV